jgi:hypothetical protein
MMDIEICAKCLHQRVCTIRLKLLKNEIAMWNDKVHVALTECQYRAIEV